ncbi:unnamed protein product [Calypogeia fissa]
MTYLGDNVLCQTFGVFFRFGSYRVLPQQVILSKALQSRASSPGLIGTQVSEKEEKVKEQFRSSTPVAHILRPYLHRGSIPAAATSRYSFIQNRPWSPEPQSDKDKAIIVDLNILVREMKKELRKKDEIILQLRRDPPFQLSSSRPESVSSTIPQVRNLSDLLESSSLNLSLKKPLPLRRRLQGDQRMSLYSEELVPFR